MWYKDLILPHFIDLDPTQDRGPVVPWSSCRSAQLHLEHWNDVLDKKPADLLPEWPNERSDRREDGYAQWDAIAANGVHSCRKDEVLDPRDDSTVQPARGKNFNGWWYDFIRPRRARCERFDEEFAVTLKGTDYGRALLEDAHCLAHYRGDLRTETRNELATHGSTAFDLIRATAELFVAERLGLPVRWDDDGKTSLPHGLFVYPDVRMGFGENSPEARLPLPSKNHVVFDDVTAVLLVVVELGPDPRALANLPPSPLDDWWAYQPVAVYLAGWESAAWMTSQKVRKGRQVGWSPPPKMEFVSPVNDLLPPGLLREWVPKGSESDFQRSIDKLKLSHQAFTPMFPCNSCLCYSGEVDDGLSRPRGIKPKTWKLAEEDWAAYRDKWRLARREIDKAKKRYYGAGFVKDRAARRRGYEHNRKVIVEKRRKKKW